MAERRYLPVAGPSILEAPTQAADSIDYQSPDEVVLDGAVWKAKLTLIP